jgi:U2-associated protein SR140
MAGADKPFSFSLKKSAAKIQEEEKEKKRIAAQKEIDDELAKTIDYFDSEPSGPPPRRLDHGSGSRGFPSGPPPRGPRGFHARRFAPPADDGFPEDWMQNPPNRSDRKRDRLGNLIERDQSPPKRDSSLQRQTTDVKKGNVSGFAAEEEEEAKAEAEELDTHIPRITVLAQGVPPETNQEAIRKWFPQSLKIDKIQILPPQDTDSAVRGASDVIIWFDQMESSKDIEAALKPLKDKYLGCGYFLTIDKWIGLKGTKQTTEELRKKLEPHVIKAAPFGAKRKPLSHPSALSRAAPPDALDQSAMQQQNHAQRSKYSQSYRNRTYNDFVSCSA